VKTGLFAIASLLGGLLLAGCQQNLTLEEAQAQCEKKGGLMVVIYSQKITASGPGEQVASPGDCVATDKFGVAPQSPPAADIK
jgi:hypothetical protein